MLHFLLFIFFLQPVQHHAPVCAQGIVMCTHTHMLHACTYTKHQLRVITKYSRYKGCNICTDTRFIEIANCTFFVDMYLQNVSLQLGVD